MQSKTGCIKPEPIVTNEIMAEEELAPPETHIKPTAPSKLNIRHDADAEFESWMEEA